MSQSENGARVVSVWTCPGCQSVLVSIAGKDVEAALGAPTCRGSSALCAGPMVRMTQSREARVVTGIAAMVGPVFVERRPTAVTVPGGY